MSTRRSAQQSLEAAVRQLASGEHGIRARLLAACDVHLRQMRAADMPVELVPMFAAICRRAGMAPGDAPRGAIAAALDAMAIADAARLAHDIVDLHCALATGAHH